MAGINPSGVVLFLRVLRSRRINAGLLVQVTAPRYGWMLVGVLYGGMEAPTRVSAVPGAGMCLASTPPG